jgi:SecD/SecF fusion protein
VDFVRNLYNFDFTGHKRWWFTLSAVLILAGLLSLFIRGGGNPLQGLNYGLEFQEGTRISVAFDGQPTLAQVRAVVSEAGHAGVQIQETQNVAGSNMEGFQIQTTTLSAEEQGDLKQMLDEQFTIARPGGTQIFSLETVGATFSAQVVSSSLTAMVIALVLILVYVTLRFQWKFAVGAVSAEFHDLLIVIGIYSITGREVTTATIAAILTILGYSLYDTVIIYDRIRENQPRFNRIPYGQMVNVSISQTLTRSMNTTLTTLLPVLALLFFGGETLKDFAFALLVGILAGAYSSIFIAAPITTVLKERDPHQRKIKSAARAAESAGARSTSS